MDDPRVLPNDDLPKCHNTPQTGRLLENSGSISSQASEGVQRPREMTTLSSLGDQGAESVQSGTSPKDIHPIWDSSIQEFKNTQPKLSELLGGQIKELLNRLDTPKWDTWSDISSNKAWARFVSRMKARLPPFKTAKSLAVSVAALDPHKLAPIIVTGVFVAIELIFEITDPQLRETALSTILHTGIIINKWVDYEADLSQMKRSHTLDITKLIDKELRELYPAGLNLIASILDDFKTKGAHARAVILENSKLWDEKSKVLGRHDSKCVEFRRRLDEELKKKGENMEILKWIKNSNEDPEPTHETVKERTGLSVAEIKAGEWLLDIPQFKTWVDGIVEGKNEKRVLWLKGVMGTGKTTLMCRVVSEFKDQPRRGIRFIQYYCDGSNTKEKSKPPDYQTIIRALCCRLAWNDDGSIANAATDLFNESKNTRDESVGDKRWETLLNNLISAQPAAVVLAIDALDECRDTSNCRKLLEWLRSVKHPRLYLLFSSRPHVEVRDYFPDVESIDIVSPQAESDMETFIKGQLAAKKEEGVSRKSIFFTHPETEKRLQQALHKTAGGMYRWVEVWLGVFFPLNHKPIQDESYAKKLLSALKDLTNLSQLSDYDKEDQMRSAYNRLWDINSDGEQYRDRQIRLFRIVLGSLEEMSPQILLEAMRFDPEQPDKYDENFKLDQLEGLYHNFLKTNQEGKLIFEHVSAKAFVSEHGDKETFSHQKNNSVLANIAIAALGQPNNPLWKIAGIDLNYWARMATVITNGMRGVHNSYWFNFTFSPRINKLKDRLHSLKLDPEKFNIQAIIAQDHFFQYLSRSWLRHCQAADGDDRLAQRLVNVVQTGSFGFDALCCVEALLQPGEYTIYCSFSHPYYFPVPENSLTQSSPSGGDFARPHLFLFMAAVGLSPFTAHSSGVSGAPQLRAGFHKADLRVRNLAGYTLLHIAVVRENYRMVRDILEFESDSPSSVVELLTSKGDSELTPLYFTQSQKMAVLLFSFVFDTKPGRPSISSSDISKLLENSQRGGYVRSMHKVIGLVDDDLVAQVLQTNELVQLRELPHCNTLIDLALSKRKKKTFKFLAEGRLDEPGLEEVFRKVEKLDSPRSSVESEEREKLDSRADEVKEIRLKLNLPLRGLGISSYLFR
ncbi:hypothetical protein GQX73_g4697 [Xylaria multiplex]|uniref:Nephrocystin 3-like N-terminal domain-containing protein n=1 Tax=Xylaria multiplex TaxID=323545 RepID=A0A7C8MQG8_9PEZI|nr:hypothetical protein GQX73_g4697 [Xylaria multiplex]